MKKILIALDYNPTAQKVAEAGYALAKAMNAEVILIHIISDPFFYSSAMYSPIMGFGGYQSIDASQPLVVSLEETSLDYLNKSKNHLGDKNIQSLVKQSDDVAGCLLEAAKELQANVIVMGSHSRRWLEKILLGSVAENVLKQTCLPLFIIPTNKKVD